MEPDRASPHQTDDPRPGYHDPNYAAGLGACAAVGAVCSINIFTLVWQGLPEHPFWALLIGAIASHATLFLFLCMISVGLIVPLAAVLRLMRIDRLWGFLVVFVLLSLVPDLISALPPAPGRTFSASLGDCEAIVDNVLTECGEELAWQRRLYRLACSPIACLAFYWIYRTHGSTKPTAIR